MLWKVLRNGKDSGIIESNLEYAVEYWANFAKTRPGVTFKLVRIK